MRARSAAIAISLILIAAILAAFYISFDKVIVLAFKTHNLDIAYKKFTNNAFRQFIFKDFSLIAKDRKIGFTAGRAVITPKYAGIFRGGIVYDFEFADFRFISQQTTNAADTSGNIDDIIGVPFSERWAYVDVRGTLQRRKDSLYIERLLAESPKIKLDATGTLNDDRKLAITITMYFKKELFAALPDDWSRAVLKSEPNDWQSLTVNLSGDLSRPSIEMTGNLFRLTIREKQP